MAASSCAVAGLPTHRPGSGSVAQDEGVAVDDGEATAEGVAEADAIGVKVTPAVGDDMAEGETLGRRPTELEPQAVNAATANVSTAPNLRLAARRASSRFKSNIAKTVHMAGRLRVRDMGR
jgi:hypothetical protein